MTAATPAAASANWSITPSPNSGTNNNLLNGVSCASATSCKAVGYYYNGTTNQALIESWNGTAWSIAPGPNIKSTGLGGVSCVSARSCWAVGTRVTSGVNRTLIESWDGTSWTIVSSPNHGTGENDLFGVSCASARSCWAVGQYFNTSLRAEQTLIESWNGTTWSIASSPNRRASYNFLNGVSCSSTTSCKTVGTYYLKSSGIGGTLIESWNGTTWSIASNPKNASDADSLTGVSCVSASSCQAVGEYFGPCAPTFCSDQTVVESWNGTTWSIVPSPNPGDGSLLDAVSCASARSCQAVGTYLTGPSPNDLRTLIASWNGTTWSITLSPNSGTNNNILNGVSCVSARSCKAVGHYVNTSGVDQTLIESYG